MSPSVAPALIQASDPQAIEYASQLFGFNTGDGWTKAFGQVYDTVAKYEGDASLRLGTSPFAQLILPRPAYLLYGACSLRVYSHRVSHADVVFTLVDEAGLHAKVRVSDPGASYPLDTWNLRSFDWKDSLEAVLGQEDFAIHRVVEVRAVLENISGGSPPYYVNVDDLRVSISRTARMVSFTGGI